MGAQYAVGKQYTVGVSAKRSIHTVDLANMGGGDCYLSAKRSDPPMQWGIQYTVGVRSLYPHRVDAVGTQYAVCSRC